MTTHLPRNTRRSSPKRVFVFLTLLQVRFKSAYIADSVNSMYRTKTTASVSRLWGIYRCTLCCGMCLHYRVGKKRVYIILFRKTRNWQKLFFNSQNVLNFWKICEISEIAICETVEQYSKRNFKSAKLNCFTFLSFHRKSYSLFCIYNLNLISISENSIDFCKIL